MEVLDPVSVWEGRFDLLVYGVSGVAVVLLLIDPNSAVGESEMFVFSDKGFGWLWWYYVLEILFVLLWYCWDWYDYGNC